MRSSSTAGHSTGPQTFGEDSLAAAVACRDIRKQFPGRARALDGISLDCPAGSTLVLVGPSGCGKTTLLRCIAGLERSTSGDIWINGRNVTTDPPEARHVAMVFQNHALYPNKTVAQHIDFPLRMARVDKPIRQRRVQEVAVLLRLGDLLDRRPHQLSGGQRQRVGVGRALARAPEVLLMDEPLSSLDAALRTQMRAELRTLFTRLGTTVIYVTHDQVEALTLADKVAVMSEGRIHQFGSPEEVFDEPADTFTAAFFGAMNLIGGRITNGALTSPAPPATVADSGATTTMTAGQVTIGIRPEHLRIRRPGEPGFVLRGQVKLTELLGSEALVHLELADGTTVALRLPARDQLSGTVEAVAAPRDVHLFGADGRRLTGRHILAPTADPGGE